jgi:hypothetical protein
MATDAAERDRLNYSKMATQYYLAGRIGTFAGSLPVAANLLHHAVEMYLKADLRTVLSREDLKSSYGHDLRATWKEFKAQHDAAGLGAHDATIRALHKFERIRYPDAIADRGMFASIAIARPLTPPRMSAASGVTPPNYHLVLADVDHLVRAIFDATGMNPGFYFQFPTVPKKFQTFIYRHNPAFRRARRPRARKST